MSKLCFYAVYAILHLCIFREWWEDKTEDLGYHVRSFISKLKNPPR